MNELHTYCAYHIQLYALFIWATYPKTMLAAQDVAGPTEAKLRENVKTMPSFDMSFLEDPVTPSSTTSKNGCVSSLPSLSSSSPEDY